MPPVDTSYPGYCRTGPPECEVDADCNRDCTCEDFTCEPPSGQDPGYCDLGPGECLDDRECNLGCSCDPAGTCVPAGAGVDSGYCQDGASPSCMEPDLVVTVTEDESDGDLSETDLSLREAIELAGVRAGSPHRIRFAPHVPVVAVLLGDLPPLPSLTYLDGGEGVEIDGMNSAMNGITVSGTGVAVSDLTLVGFQDAAVDVDAGSEDVHLFRLTIGSRNRSNGRGIMIHDSRRVFIGRGRELACNPDPPVPLQDPPLWSRPANLVLNTDDQGISASLTDDLSISSTWVGFDEQAGHGGADREATGVGGVGIHLVEVNRATIGADFQIGTEAMLVGPDDVRPLYVGVGRCEGGGVLIQGGGDIRMPGLFLGDVSLMTPYDQNLPFQLRIEDNQHPVVYGPSLDARGPAAGNYNLVYTEGAPVIQIIEPQAEVILRAVQIECLQDCFTASGGPPHAVVVRGAAAPVRLIHLTTLYHFREAVVRIEALQPGGAVELVNNLFVCYPSGGNCQVGETVIESIANAGLPAGAITLGSNFNNLYPSWCSGDCGVVSMEGNSDHDDWNSCNSVNAWPLDTRCPVVDAAAVIKRDGVELDVNGAMEGLHNGCGPDVGFAECFYHDGANPYVPAEFRCPDTCP